MVGNLHEKKILCNKNENYKQNCISVFFIQFAID